MKVPTLPIWAGHSRFRDPIFSWSPDFTTILSINEIVTYHFLAFLVLLNSFSFLYSSVFPFSHHRHLKCQSWSFYRGRPYVPRFSIAIETLLFWNRHIFLLCYFVLIIVLQLFNIQWNCEQKIRKCIVYYLKNFVLASSIHFTVIHRSLLEKTE